MVTREQVVEALKRCLDPEIRIDVWTLGLIYNLEVEKDVAKIKMTFTTPMCPFGPQLLENIKSEVSGVKGIKGTDIQVVFEPLWKPSEELKEMLGLA